MAVTNFIDIDGTKFRKELGKRELNINNTSENLGYARGYLTTVIRKGKISKSCALAIESTYNIKIDSYKIDKDVVVEKSEVEKPAVVQNNSDIVAILDKLNTTLSIISLHLGRIEENTKKCKPYVVSPVSPSPSDTVVLK